MALGSVVADNVMMSSKLLAGRETAAVASIAAEAGGQVSRQAADALTMSPELTSALMNRSVEVQQQIADLTARTDILANKLNGVKKIVDASKSDNTWFVNTWNSETRHGRVDGQITFLRRRWDNDRGHFDDMRAALNAETPVHASALALPLLSEEDVVLSERAVGALRQHIGGAQQQLAELTVKHDLLAAKVENAKSILGQQESNGTWFTNDWNNSTRHGNDSGKVSRLREMWDSADGFRNSLAAIL